MHDRRQYWVEWVGSTFTAVPVPRWHEKAVGFTPDGLLYHL